ncbi:MULTISPECIES: hypothetical protein [unclassified Xanthobacter]|uniref:hypothetical protein n=1 Tax=unclassified Xanthobacter TaxID=2623496 RepID=UPI001EE121C7|nr:MULTISPECIES: hypothetical protein [unclassified Xanthobacter]
MTSTALPSASPESAPLRHATGPERTRDCDVCVIGDDMAGLLMACDLATRGLEVVLVSLARQPEGLGLDATLAPGYGLSARALRDAVGQADAQDLLRLSVAAAERGMALATGAGLTLGAKGRLAVARPAAADDLWREAEAFNALVPGGGVVLDAADTQALLATPTYVAALGVVPAQQVGGAAFRQLLEAAVADCGLTRLPQPAALSIDGHGIRKYVTLPGLRVRAAHLVFSGGAELVRWAPELAPSLVTRPWVRGRFHVPAGTAAYGGLAEEVGATGLRWRFEGDSLALAAETAFPPWGRASAARCLRRHVSAVAPAARRALVEQSHGVALTHTRHGMPLFAEGEKGVWFCVTMGLEELAHGVLGARLITDAIVARDDRIRLFQPFGLEPPGARPQSRFRSVLDYLQRRVRVATAARAARSAPVAETAEPG